MRVAESRKRQMNLGLDDLLEESRALPNLSPKKKRAAREKTDNILRLAEESLASPIPHSPPQGPPLHENDDFSPTDRTQVRPFLRLGAGGCRSVPG